jgi:arginine N-succinyltransferase
MLRRIGFTYAERIDPFDGGPHFLAKTDEITLVRNTKRGKVDVWDKTPATQFGLISIERDHAPHFIAAGSPFWMEGKNVLLPKDTFENLGLHAGDEVGVLPI